MINIGGWNIPDMRYISEAEYPEPKAKAMGKRPETAREKAEVLR